MTTCPTQEQSFKVRCNPFTVVYYVEPSYEAAVILGVRITDIEYEEFDSKADANQHAKGLYREMQAKWEGARD